MIRGVKMLSFKASFDSQVVLLSNRIRSYFLAVLGNSNSESDDVSWENHNLLSNCVRMELALEENPTFLLELVKNMTNTGTAFAGIIDTVDYSWNRIVTGTTDTMELMARFADIASTWSCNKANQILSRMSKYSEDHLKQLEYTDDSIDDRIDVDKIVVNQVVKRLNANPKNTPVTELYVSTMFQKFITLSGITNQDTIDEKCQEVFASLLGYVKTLTINGIDIQRKVIFQASTTEQLIRQLQRNFPEPKKQP